MGTVGNQPPRECRRISEDEFYNWISHTKQLAQEHGVTFRDVVELMKVEEMQRANAIAMQDGDYRDEHIKGICDALKEIANEIEAKQ